MEPNNGFANNTSFEVGASLVNALAAKPFGRNAPFNLRCFRRSRFNESSEKVWLRRRLGQRGSKIQGDKVLFQAKIKSRPGGMGGMLEDISSFRQRDETVSSSSRMLFSGVLRVK